MAVPEPTRLRRRGRRAGVLMAVVVPRLALSWAASRPTSGACRPVVIKAHWYIEKMHVCDLRLSYFSLPNFMMWSPAIFTNCGVAVIG